MGGGAGGVLRLWELVRGGGAYRVTAAAEREREIYRESERERERRVSVYEVTPGVRLAPRAERTA